MRLPSAQIKKRVLVILIAFVVALFLLTVRVGWIQIVRGSELSEEALGARTREIEIQPKRGVIADRKGRELAVSVDVDSLYAVPLEVRDVQETARVLAEILDVDPLRLEEKLSRSASFVWLKRKLSQKASERVRNLDLPGLYFTKESKRFYPKGSLAGHILGFAGIDTHGLEGIEYSQDEALHGTPGKIVMEFDARGREIPQATYRHVSARPGDKLYLTIDEIVQYIAERELANKVAEVNARGGTILVMNPHTGRILAMAAIPSYDPNLWPDYPPNRWRNPVISDVFHPGSVFKPVTAAGALEEGAVTPETPFTDPGYVKVPGAVIHNWNRQGLGDTTFAEGFARSANVIFVKTALRMGIPDFYRYLWAFGLDSPTGIDLPGEASSIYPREENAKEVDLAVMGFGQTLAVTPLQMSTALSCIINGGYLLKPHLVYGVENAETGEMNVVEREVLRRVLSEETSATVRRLMVQVVESGTGGRAKIPGYEVGGKTGTAQKTVAGVVSKEKHISSFAGFAPADDPEILCYVTIDEPEGVYYGSTVAGPVFRKVVEETLHYLEVPPDFPEELNEAELPQPPGVEGNPGVVPDVEGKSVKAAREILEREGLTAEVIGDGADVKEQFPGAGIELRRGAQVLLHTQLAEDYLEDEKAVVPDLTGQTLRAAGEVLSERGLRMEVTGSGVVVGQHPDPGTRVPRGTIINLTLKRSGS